MEFIKDVLNIDNLGELYEKLKVIVEKIDTKYLKEDLSPLFEDGAFLDMYCKNYKRMVNQYLKID